MEEVGEGPGLGFNVNIPWPKKGAGDADYRVSEGVEPEGGHEGKCEVFSIGLIPCDY